MSGVDPGSFVVRQPELDLLANGLGEELRSGSWKT